MGELIEKWNALDENVVIVAGFAVGFAAAALFEHVQIKLAAKILSLQIDNYLTEVGS